MQNKNIAFLCRTYPWTAGRTVQPLQEICEALVQRGWMVTVIAGKSNSDQANSALLNGVHIKRIPGFSTSGRGGGWSSFLAGCLLCLRLPRQIAFVTTPGSRKSLWLGLAMKWLKRGKLVHWADEFDQESVKEGGAIQFHTRKYLPDSIRCIRNSDAIVTLDQETKSGLVTRSLSPYQITVIPNWASQSTVEKSEDRQFNLARAARQFTQLLTLLSGEDQTQPVGLFPSHVSPSSER